MKKTLYSVLSTSIISVCTLQAQSTFEDNSTATNLQSFTASLEEQKALFVELDSIRKNVDTKVDVSFEEATILRRMKLATRTIPLDYNSQVKSYIDKYISANYRPYMSRLHGLSNHYFKVYDKVFKEMGVPDEIKYLSVVESSLNPHLVSSAGAVGPWQFIYTTARIYDLDMNAHIDERKDIYAATYAVSKYLKESYDQFNDWLLAVASYNCGRGCVQRAIQRSGMNQPTFWELSPYLPKETQNYIPKYVAMTYVLSNAHHYNIEAAQTELNYDTKVIMVDKVVEMRYIAEAVNLDITSLKYFNPAYKKNVVNGSSEKPKRLFLPLTPNTNDSLLYVALNAPSSISIPLNDVQNQSLANLSNEKYKVRKGESLSSVSKKFGVTVQDLKAWNGLRTNSLLVGRSIIVSKPINTTIAKHVTRSAAKQKHTQTAYYVVKNGDSLERIAKKFTGSTVAKIKEDNGLKNTLIKPGMKLKIRKG